MNEQTIEKIKNYLQNKDVQERILKNIECGRSEATVTIGRAARLFDFTENQLRDWEDKGLLKPQRPSGGQRQYTPFELDKLAIIRELIDAKYAPSEIPADIDTIWNSICVPKHYQPSVLGIEEAETEHLPIDKRKEQTDEALFWRYFASQVLRLSLMLIREAVPDTIAGLVLPLRLKDSLADMLRPEELPQLGQSLIGWLELNGSIYVLLDSTPSFEYPSDFRLLPLRAMKDESPTDGATKEKTLIVLQRKTRLQTLSVSAVVTIRRLLAPLYEDVQNWESYFGPGRRDTLYPATDFTSSNSSDILNGLADMVVRLGGKTTDGRDRWRFCCILLPHEADLMLPLRQRSLVVQAQSKNAPYKVGITTLFPDKYVNSLNLRAFQSGHIVYRPEVSAADSTIAMHELDGPMRSAIAVSIGGEQGNPIAILYVVSDEVRAFSTGDQRVLRMMGRIIEELLLTYLARQQVTKNLGDLINKPELLDSLFSDFLSENDFRRDVEEFLTGIKMRMDSRKKFPNQPSVPPIRQVSQSEKDQLSEGVISFIGVDLDNQNFLAIKYGDQMVRELSRAIGLRLQEMLISLFTKHTDCKLYHINANRFYLLLKGIPLKQAREKAESMRQAFEGQIAIERQALPSIVLSDVTVRLAVASFLHEKLEENLVSDDETVDIVAEVKSKIARSLDVALKMGMDAGGNVVIAWNYEVSGGAFVRWSPHKTS